jgi:hypothetical protein
MIGSLPTLGALQTSNFKLQTSLTYGLGRLQQQRYPVTPPICA